MTFQSTPNANRMRIALFGRRNVGKSSLLNALTEQSVSIVSNIAGTTTDPVQKAMELLPLGPVVFYDTAGIDDVGELGQQRIQKTMNILKTVDIAVLVTDQMNDLTAEEQALFDVLEKQATPTIVVHNKIDDRPNIAYKNTQRELWVSAQTNQNIDLLRQTISFMEPVVERPLVSDLINANDIVLLVVPIDESAPKGRLILPQQQIIRDLLDHHAMAIIAQPEQIPFMISTYGDAIRLVITDSQVFKEVNMLLPKTMPLTSFSILFARFKGVLEQSLQGVAMLDLLTDQDSILICEGCTHKRQCNDIGTVKIPKWIQNYTKKELNFEHVSGNNFPSDLSSYSLIIHCGGCMLHENIMQERRDIAREQNIPFTNYGLLIAKLNGIVERSLAPLQG